MMIVYIYKKKGLTINTFKRNQKDQTTHQMDLKHSAAPWLD